MLAVATHTFTVQRPDVTGGRDPYGDGYGTPSDGPGPNEPAGMSTVATGVRGVFSAPSGREQGARESVDWRVLLDPCPVTHNDHLVDEATTTRYRVEWVAHRTGLDLDHVATGVVSFVGVAG